MGSFVRIAALLTVFVALGACKQAQKRQSKKLGHVDISANSLKQNTADLDNLIRGTWQLDCQPSRDSSVKYTLEFTDLDKGLITADSYANQKCEGTPKSSTQTFKYDLAARAVATKKGDGVVGYGLKLSFDNPSEGQISSEDLILYLSNDKLTTQITKQSNISKGKEVAQTDGVLFVPKTYNRQAATQKSAAQKPAAKQ